MPDTINTTHYPELHLLCWNRAEHHISRRDAFSLYESHWHLISRESLTERESELIKALTDEFGQGLINA